MSSVETVEKSKKNRVEIPHFSPEVLKILAQSINEPIYDLELLMADNPAIHSFLHTITMLDTFGIRTIGQLLQLRTKDLLSLQYVSFVSVQQIYDCLANYHKMPELKRKFKKEEKHRLIYAQLIRQKITRRTKKQIEADRIAAMQKFTTEEVDV